MIVALDAAASWMSFSVMPPTPRWTNASLTSSRSSLRSASVSASSEPVTSALSDQVQRGGLARLDLLEDVLELGAAARDRGVAAEAGDALPVLAGLADATGHLLVGGDHELVAGVGDVGQAEHLHRRRRAGLLDLLAVVVDQRPDPAPGGAGDERVADLRACPAARARWPPGPGRRRGWPRAPRPRPARRGWPRSSSTSATSRSFSSRSSMPRLWRAETSTMIVSPPQSLGDEALLGRAAA